MSIQTKLSKNVLHRSKLIALSRALGLLDSEQARRLSKELKRTPSARDESAREALYELYASEALDLSDLQQLSEFANELQEDVAWLTSPPKEEIADSRADTIAISEDATECEESNDSFEPIEANELQCEAGVVVVAPKTLPDSSSSTTPAAKDGVHMPNRYGTALADQPNTSAPEVEEAGTKENSPSENVSSSPKKSASSKDKSGRRSKKHRSSKIEEYDFNPTWDARLGIFFRRIPRVISKSVGDLFEKATQTRNSTLTTFLGIAVTLFLAGIGGLAWYNQQSKKSGPTAKSSSNVSGTSAQPATSTPASDPLENIKALVSEQDFDGALIALEDLESTPEIDQASVKIGLLLAKEADLEARDLLLETMDFESETWRFQFAVWLANTSAKYCSEAKEQIDNAESNASALYRIRAWLQARDVAGDWRYALSMLTELDYDRCEVGDLLYRAAAHTRRGNYEEAQLDLQELALRLDNQRDTEFAKSLCLARLKSATEKLSGGLAGRIEKASQIR